MSDQYGKIDLTYGPCEKTSAGLLPRRRVTHHTYSEKQHAGELAMAVAMRDGLRKAGYFAEVEESILVPRVVA